MRVSNIGRLMISTMRPFVCLSESCLTKNFINAHSVSLLSSVVNETKNKNTTNMIAALPTLNLLVKEAFSLIKSIAVFKFSSEMM